MLAPPCAVSLLRTRFRADADDPRRLLVLAAFGAPDVLPLPIAGPGIHVVEGEVLRGRGACVERGHVALGELLNRILHLAPGGTVAPGSWGRSSRASSGVNTILFTL